MVERIRYFDILRGLAILGVVAIHSSSAGLRFSDNSLNFHFTVLWRQLINFSVPLFIAISGYFLAKKSMAHVDKYFTFLKKQIPRVYVPYFFWSIAWLVLAILTQNQSIIRELYELVTFQSSGPYYFIALIIQYYILLPILKRLANIKGLVFSIITSIVMSGVIFYIRYFTNISLPLIVYAGNFVTWIMFFVLGLYLGSSASINISNKLLISLTLVFYSLSCIESYVLYEMSQQAESAVTAVKASSFMYSLVLIVFLFKNHNIIKSKVLKSIGEISFGVYLIHMFVLMVASRLLSRFFSPIESFQPIYQFALICIVIFSCFLCISIGNKVFTIKQRQIIGFK